MAKKQAGVYFGRLTQTGLDSLKTPNQTPFIFLTFKVTHISDGNGWVVTPEFSRDIKMFLSEKAWPYTQKQLNKLGFNGDFYDPKFNSDLYEPGIKLLCTIKRHGEKEYEDWELPFNGEVKERKLPSKDVINTLTARWKNDNSLNAAPPSDGPASADNIESPFD